MRQILERPAERVDRVGQLAGQPALHGPRRLPEVVARLAVSEPQAGLTRGIHRKNRVIGREESIR